MAPDILIRAGDTLPVVRRTLEVDGTPVNLASATAVTFKAVSAAGVTVITGPCTVIDAVNGIVDYVWQSADALLPAGFYQASYVVTFASSSLSLPNAGYLVLQITSSSQGTWSYSGNPSASLRDAVRYFLGDIDSTDQLMADAEIDYVIAEWSDTITRPRLLAAACADDLANRYAREVAVSADGVTTSLQDLVENYRQLAVALRAQDARRLIAGPDLDVDIDSYQDPTVRPFSFGVGMHDNLRVGPSYPELDHQLDEYYGGVW